MSARRILVGVTLWAPEQFRRLDPIRRAFAALARASAGGSFDLLVVDNDSRHPETADILAGVRRSIPEVEVHRFSPQRGWGGARNHMIRRFMDGSWERLVMLDQDIILPEPVWPERILSLIDEEPELHAYLMLGVRWQHRGLLQLPRSGRWAAIGWDYLGGCHIIGREVARRIGGYNVADFPIPYGHHDAEFGLRLQAAGLLGAANGHYVDPLFVPVIHMDPTDPSSERNKYRVSDQFTERSSQRAEQIRRGLDLYRDYRVDVPVERLRARPVASDDDVEELRRIRNQCAEFMTRDPRLISAEEQRRWWADPRRPYECFLFYAAEEPAGAPVGYGLVNTTDGKSWLSGGLRPERRGQGLGRFLFGELVRRSSGVPHLEVRRDNPRALRLYSRLGFQPVGEDRSKLTMKLVDQREYS
jgi:ribosomal protein S18 acetylase RimI-like enzyme